MKCAHHSNGFTLVEVLLYVAIASAIAVTSFQALELFNRATAWASSQSAVDTEAAFVMSAVQNVLRAGSADVPVNQNTSASLEVSDGTVISLTDGVVVIERSTGTPERLTSARITVSDLSFQDVSVSGSPDLVLVRFTATASPSDQAASGASQSYVYTTTIGIR